MDLKKQLNYVWDGLKGPEMDEVFSRIGPSMAISPRRPDKSRKRTEDDPNRLRGTVKAYYTDRLFGFIEPDDVGEPQLFVHGSAAADGVNLRRGMRVSYDIHRDIKRGKTSAANVRVIYE